LNSKGDEYLTCGVHKVALTDRQYVVIHYESQQIEAVTDGRRCIATTTV